MAVPVNDRLTRVVANGQASGEQFNFTFPILVDTDLYVDWIDNSTGIVTTLVLNVDYLVDASNQIITIVGATVNGDIYVIIGNTPYARATDFSGATSVTVNALNTDYNEEEKQIQQLNRDFGFCISMPLSDEPSINMVLPTADVRKDLYLKFDENGNVEVSAGTGGGASGDVIGPGSATDNAVVRWDGTTGELIQNSVAILSDAGALSGLTELTVDNIDINGNTIVSTNTNGDIIITPNGTGSIILDSQKWPQADGTTDQVLSTNGLGQTIWKTLPELSGVQGPGSSTNSALAVWDGTSGALLKDSSIIYTSPGELSAIQNLTVDNINVNGNTITSTNTNGDIIITPNGTGNIVLEGLNWPQSDGANTNVLTTDGAGQLFWSAGGGGGGGVSGPVSSTDTAIATWNGTGGSALRNTATLIDTTTGKITSVGSTTTPGSIQLNEAPSTGSDGIVITAPSSVTAYTVTMPNVVGSVGNVLADTDGAGTMEWRGGMTLLYSTTISSPTAAVDYVLPTGYFAFKLYATEIVPVTNAVNFLFRTSTDGGMTFASGSSDYDYLLLNFNNAGVSTSGPSFKASGSYLTTQISNSYAVYCITADFFEANSATGAIQGMSSSYYANSTPNLITSRSSGARNSGSMNNAIRFAFSSGNIASGKFRFYGIN